MLKTFNDAMVIFLVVVVANMFSLIIEDINKQPTEMYCFEAHHDMIICTTDVMSAVASIPAEPVPNQGGSKGSGKIARKKRLHSF